MRTVSGVRGGVLCFICDVAIELTPVSPRGSAPSVELLRRRRVLLAPFMCAVSDAMGSKASLVLYKAGVLGVYEHPRCYILNAV